MARLVLVLALVVAAIVAVSTAPAPQRKRRIIIIVIRRKPRDVSNQMEVHDEDVKPIGDHPLESIITPSKSRFARAADYEPQYLYEEGNTDHAPATGDHPFLSRYAQDIHNPEVMYVMKPLDDEEQE